MLATCLLSLLLLTSLRLAGVTEVTLQVSLQLAAVSLLHTAAAAAAAAPASRQKPPPNLLHCRRLHVALHPSTMAYLYSSSKTWRRIVDATSRSAPTMLAFAAACVAVPWFLGDQVGLACTC